MFQSSINQPRQKTQAIVKQACQKAGVEVEVKTVVASVYFSSGSSPTPIPAASSAADLEMHTWYSGADPEVFMRGCCSWEACATKENKWSGRNSTRWQSRECDETFKAATVETRPGRSGPPC